MINVVNPWIDEADFSEALARMLNPGPYCEDISPAGEVPVGQVLAALYGDVRLICTEPLGHEGDHEFYQPATGTTVHWANVSDKG